MLLPEIPEENDFFRKQSKSLPSLAPKGKSGAMDTRLSLSPGLDWGSLAQWLEAQTPQPDSLGGNPTLTLTSYVIWAIYLISQWLRFLICEIVFNSLYYYKN